RRAPHSFPTRRSSDLMTGIPLLVTCLAVGVVAARVLAQLARLARGISWWVLRIALPALVLTLLPRLEFERSLWFLIAAMWLVFVDRKSTRLNSSHVKN